MEISQGLNKMDKIVKQLDYESLHIEIVTKDDTWTLDKQKPKNPIGFNVIKGGEISD